MNRILFTFVQMFILTCNTAAGYSNMSRIQKEGAGRDVCDITSLRFPFRLSSNFQVMQTTIEVAELENFTNEKFAVAMRNLRISNVNHVVINEEI